MATNMFNDYFWHSCLEPKKGIAGKRIIRSIKADSDEMNHFMKISKDGSFLVHKSTKALWKFSDDGKTIEPVFKDDVLTEDEL